MSHFIAILAIALFVPLALLAKDTNAPNYDYTPNRSALLPSKSVRLDQNDPIEFFFNRGEGSVVMLEKFLVFTDPATIKNTPGYTSPKNTRITLMTYELRSKEVLDRVELLVSEGYQVRVVSDSSTFTLARMPSEDEQKTWSETQSAYFYANFDKNRDGKVTQEELDHSNKAKRLTKSIWDQLTALKEKHPTNLELVATPYELVPADAQSLYPRLTHLKYYAIELKQEGRFAPQAAMIVSANLTDTCLKCRVAPSDENIQNYLDGKEHSTAKGSEGHIQFGAIVKSPKALEALSGPIEKWIEAYKVGKHFDSVELSDELLPRIVFDNPKLQAPSVLTASFSEGTKSRKRKPLDPLWGLTKILSQPDIELKVYYDSQFVYTHKALALHVRHHLAQDSLEEFGVFVDGKFAVESYSALPELLFAPKVDEAPFALPRKALQDYMPVRRAAEWQKNVFVYEGDRGIFNGPADKLHTKLTYFEYIDKKTGLRHFVVAWGSANKSSNSGKLNADGLFIFDTVDTDVQIKMRTFFKALREEKRMRSYASAYLERRLREMIVPNEEIFSEPEAEKPGETFLEQFQALLDHESDHASNRAALARLLETMKEAKAINEYGENFFGLIDWYLKNASETGYFGWSDFYIALQMAHPLKNPSAGLREDVFRKWAPKGSTKSAYTAFNKALDKMSRNPNATKLRLTRNVARIMRQCENALTRIGLPAYNVPELDMHEINSEPHGGDR